MLSTSKLFEVSRNQRLDIETLHFIALMGSPNVSQLAKMVGKDRNRIKYHLYRLKAEGYVKDHFVSARTPLNYLIQCHEWQLTNKGKRFLREGGLPLPVFQHDGSLSASKADVESSRDKTAGIMASREGTNTEINFFRANQAATILHAFSLVQKTSRPR